MIAIYVPTPYRKLAGGAASLVGQGRTVRELLEDLTARYPDLAAQIWANGEVRHYINVYVNGEEIRELQGLETPLHDGDTVAFVPALVGGATEPAAPETPFAEGRIVIPLAHYQEMVRHAEEEYPNECCGLLAGRDATVERVYRMRNIRQSPVMYTMDPKEQLRVFEEIDQAGQTLVGIYHSHTHSPAYPSPTDIRLAFYPDSAYVIISLADRSRPEVRAFQIVDGTVRELEVVVLR